MLTTDPLVAPEVAAGHVLGDVPGMVQGFHVRWDCSVCGCWVWLRKGREPYGTALDNACSTLVGRGRVTCGNCTMTWDWPGTFPDEAAGRAYVNEHRCGRQWMRVTVIEPAPQ